MNISTYSKMTKNTLIAEIVKLTERIAQLEEEKSELELLLEVTTDHANIFTEHLQTENEDLEIMLAMTTEHSDVLSKELTDQAEFIRDTFGRYVNEEVVTTLLDSPHGLVLGGEKCKATIMFTDLRGFTALSSRLDPKDVVAFLNHYLEIMVKIILGHYGTIIELLGDGILVIFGAPIQRADDAERAVACAVAMQAAMPLVNAPLQAAGFPELEMGIGIHTGEVVVGHIGSSQRTKYGAVGNPINLAGRIESYTVGGQILISEVTQAEVGELVQIKQILQVEPKGVQQPIVLYDVIGIIGNYAQCLPTQKEELHPLAQPLVVSFSILEEKFSDRTGFPGQIVQLSRKEAVLQITSALQLLSNLKIKLTAGQGPALDDELFAKVIRCIDTSPYTYLVHFTSIPLSFITMFRALLGEGADLDNQRQFSNVCTQNSKSKGND